MKAGLFMAAFLILMLSASMGAAENTKPESGEETIRRLEAEIRILRSTVAALVKENKSLKAEVAALRSGEAAEGDPAPRPAKKDAPAEPEKIISFYRPKDFAIGAVGRFYFSVRFEQVLGPTEVVCSIPVYKDASGPPVLVDRWRFLLREFPTEGFVDRMERYMKDAVFVVRSTHTAELANGGTETLFVLVPYIPDAATPKPGS